MAYAGDRAMNMERKVSFFRNGRNQAVRIPREFETEASEGLMRREGTKIIIETEPKKGLLEVLRTMKPSRETLPEIEDFPPEPVTCFDDREDEDPSGKRAA
jgi:antitoxin VapB